MIGSWGMVFSVAKVAKEQTRNVLCVKTGALTAFAEGAPATCLTVLRWEHPPACQPWSEPKMSGRLGFLFLCLRGNAVSGLRLPRLARSRLGLARVLPRTLRGQLPTVTAL